MTTAIIIATIVSLGLFCKFILKEYLEWCKEEGKPEYFVTKVTFGDGSIKYKVMQKHVQNSLASYETLEEALGRVCRETQMAIANRVVNIDIIDSSNCTPNTPEDMILNLSKPIKPIVETKPNSTVTSTKS